jgi:hypothetical protein
MGLRQRVRTDAARTGPPFTKPLGVTSGRVEASTATRCEEGASSTWLGSTIEKREGAMP